jgi:uncharacterized protein (DUF111 family)
VAALAPRSHDQDLLVVFAQALHAHRAPQDSRAVVTAALLTGNFDEGRAHERKPEHPPAHTVGDPDAVVVVHGQSIHGSRAVLCAAEFKAGFEGRAVEVVGAHMSRAFLSADINDSLVNGE